MLQNEKEINTEVFAGGFTTGTASDCMPEEAGGGRCPQRYLADTDKTGNVIHKTYFSKTCGMNRGVSILLPSQMSEKEKYPVLYMLHGIFGNENSFTDDPANRIKELVANMAAEGVSKKTIVVFPDMYATADPEKKPNLKNAADLIPYDNFEKELVNDLMPFIVSEFPVMTGRDNTGVAGFSMGGRETLYISLLHSDIIGYFSSISPAPGLTPGRDWAMEHPGTIKEEELCFGKNSVLPKRLILCCGTKDSVVGVFPQNYHELMEKNGVEHIWYEIEDADHDNDAVRSGIYEILKAMNE